MATKLIFNAGVGAVTVGIIYQFAAGSPAIFRATGADATVGAIVRGEDDTRAAQALMYKKQLQALEKEYGEGKVSTVQVAANSGKGNFTSGSERISDEAMTSRAIAALDKPVYSNRG